MLLVVDAEVIFASLIKRGFTLDLIRLLRERGYELVTPEYIFPYTALALKYRSLGSDVKIWSNDPEFREMVENKVPVISTQELKEELGLV